MYEVYLNGRATGLTYTGRNAYREAIAAAKDLQYAGGRAHASAHRVF